MESCLDSFTTLLKKKTYVHYHALRLRDHLMINSYHQML